MTDSKKQIANRIDCLRQTMNEHRIDAIIVLTADPHLSEYLPEHWQLREWLSGFSGSAGTLVVTAKDAYVWADSRYWVQAETELAGSGIELQKLQKGNNHIEWLASNLPSNSSVFADGDMLSVAEYERLSTAFFEVKISLKTEILGFWNSLYEQVGTLRPSLPTADIFRHDPQFVSVSASNKLAQVREGVSSHNATHHLLSSLDDIGWLTNLRGADIDYNPVFLAHVLISATTATLFINQNKLSDDLREELTVAGFDLADYDTVVSAIGKLTDDDSLLVDPNKVAVNTLSLANRNENSVRLIKKIAPSTMLKSRKSAQDIDNIREAMRQDGVALCEFFADFYHRLRTGERLSELDVDRMLIDYRSQQPHYVSPSFPTIAGFNANGALPHYRATPESFSYFNGKDDNGKADESGLLLIDSGAQYHNGTTDITRIVPIGKITNEHKRDFTAVLKAHIALATAYFPEGISSPQIDAICRAPLWKMQMDYGHGTGHGVGYFMNVHEGPQGISYSAPATPERAMRAGMITSNEPALYRDGQWGIRIENLVATLAVETPNETVFGEYLYFETVTYCPIDTRLIDPDMLTTEELMWLNDYHKTVYYELKDKVGEQAYQWLEKMTAPLKAKVVF